MMKREHGAAIAIGAALLVYGAVSMFRTGDIVDCDAPPIGKGYQCASVHCHRAFHERKLASDGAEISTLRVSYNFSDAPDRTVYYATWQLEGRPVIARCELNGVTVVATEFLDRLP